jgi:DNA-binding FrmR family transcriptional regulator
MRERAAQLLELEYAPDKKAADRLKQIAGHIRALDAD